jgi:hypothetical protein
MALDLRALISTYFIGIRNLLPRPYVFIYERTFTRKQQIEENIMKLRTKLAIFVVAAFLTLTGLNLIANAFSNKGVFSAHNPETSITVWVTSVRALT